jgi:hypothetical protein
MITGIRDRFSRSSQRRLTFPKRNVLYLCELKPVLCPVMIDKQIARYCEEPAMEIAVAKCAEFHRGYKHRLLRNISCVRKVTHALGHKSVNLRRCLSEAVP